MDKMGARGIMKKGKLCEKPGRRRSSNFLFTPYLEKCVYFKYTTILYSHSKRMEIHKNMV